MNKLHHIFFSRWAPPVSNQGEEPREKQNHKPLIWNNQTVILKRAREDTSSGPTILIKIWISFSFQLNFPSKWCGLWAPQDKPIHYPLPKKKKCTATISRWSSPQHFHIGILFYRIDFPGRLVSSHSFFNLQLHHPSLTAFVESKKKRREAVFSATGLHANYKPMIWLPNKPCDILIQCRIPTT